ncbi:MAG: hypothetical protein KDJ52_25325, partial [Anaerolineae bacterium]|nr:hypothetical protein [Anaerolineae bacterium]
HCQCPKPITASVPNRSLPVSQTDHCQCPKPITANEVVQTLAVIGSIMEHSRLPAHLTAIGYRLTAIG